MSKFKSQGYLNTFKNAGRGVRLSLKSEKNIRFHCLTAFLVILFTFKNEFDKNLYFNYCNFKCYGCRIY